MKKVILALAIVSTAFVACNNESDSKEATKDSAAATTVDTAAKPAVDTTAKPAVDTTAKPAADSAAAKK
ncbi:MAG: hypothetical protein E6Q96_05665 [Cyclobacteriaceae bacterium]|nr:hypothetical protein [Ferruginibacter sp.]TXH28093.1 MAG: hypothetical protein E6Q96_05665 [Cyclobacteriaceae bacterium]HNJ28531.1 hypothetical protein [Ferruginibacter sp.]